MLRAVTNRNVIGVLLHSGRNCSSVITLLSHPTQWWQSDTASWGQEPKLARGASGRAQGCTVWLAKKPGTERGLLILEIFSWVENQSAADVTFPLLPPCSALASQDPCCPSQTSAPETYLSLAPLQTHIRDFDIEDIQIQHWIYIWKHVERM